MSDIRGESERTRGRIVRNLSRDWLFCYDPEPLPCAHRAADDADTGDFHAIALPHTWHTYETTGQRHPFIRDPAESDNPYWWQGWGWYRKWFRVAARHAGRRVFLECDAVQTSCRVYCNGAIVGEHAGGFSGFSVDLTDALRWGKDNVIAVAVCARRDHPDCIPPMTAGNWNIYGGIYRQVRLVLKNPVHIPFQGAADHEGGTCITTPLVTHHQALVHITTHVCNTSSSDCSIAVQQRILAPDQSLVSEVTTATHIPAGKTASVTQESPELHSPLLWSPDAPHLYTLETTLLHNGQVLDRIDSPLGFRWFHWDYQENALYLNDERVRISGMNRHQEYPWLGDALPLWLHETDLSDMRENLGVNVARWCHYSQDRFVYDWCDRHGVLVCEEVPCIKNLPFSPAVQRRQVVEMIRRDRNHPCIIMWSMGNETDHAADGRWARDEDPTRIIHYRHVSGPAPAAEHTHQQLDMENLLRCTVRGWWEADAMEPDRVPLPADHQNGQITGSEKWQRQAACLPNGSIRGCIDEDTVAWIYADHGADREYRHCPLKHVNPKGWVDAYRQPKGIYWLWQANRTTALMVHIQDYWWRPDQLGRSRAIEVDSNGQSVELYVGTTCVGVRYPDPATHYTVTFEHVVVRDAPLCAVARRGAESRTHNVPMCGKPVALRLRCTPESLDADRSGIALLTVDAVDAAGFPVPGAHPTLQWSLDGPGEFLAPAFYESDIDRREEVEGTMYTILPVVMPLRSTRQPGVINVTVHAPDLAAATCCIPSLAVVDSNRDGIGEPPVSDGSRQRLRHQRHDACRHAAMPSDRAGLIYADIRIGSTDRRVIERHLRRALREVGLDGVPERILAPLLGTLTELAVQGNGTVIADDINVLLQQVNSKA